MNKIEDILFKLENASEYEKVDGNLKRVGFNYTIESDEEFFFICGQVLSYLVDKNKAANAKASMLPLLIYNGSIRLLKDKVNRLYSQYSHELPLYNAAPINVLVQAINSYKLGEDRNSRVRNKELWYYYNAGLIGSNHLYKI